MYASPFFILFSQKLLLQYSSAYWRSFVTSIPSYYSKQNSITFQWLAKLDKDLQIWPKITNDLCRSLVIFGDIWQCLSIFDLKCPPLIKSHEVINLVKPWHIQAIMGSQMSVVTIYALKITQIVITNNFEINFKIFWKWARLTQNDELIFKSVQGWSLK